MLNMIKAALFLVFAIGLFVVTEPYMIVRANDSVYTVDKIDKLTVDTFVFTGETDRDINDVLYYKVYNVNVKGDYVWLDSNEIKDIGRLMSGDKVRVTFKKDDAVHVSKVGKVNDYIGGYYF